MFLSRQQNAGQSCDIKITNRSFENVSQLKYLGTTETNQNLERKRKLNYGNVFYHLAQNLLSSRLLYKNVKIRRCKIIIMPAFLCGCETWSLTLREAHRLWVFENRVMRIIFGPKRDEVTGEWRKLHNEELRNLYSSPSIIRMINGDEMGGHYSTDGEKRNSYRLLV
jgi:hypothetical protein